MKTEPADEAWKLKDQWVHGLWFDFHQLLFWSSLLLQKITSKLEHKSSDSMWNRKKSWFNILPVFSIYSQGWAADARKQSSIEVTKIKALKKKQPCIFVCLFFGWFFFILFSCSTAKQCLQNGVNGETALRWVFSTSVSPSAEGTRTYSMQRQTLAECLWKHRHDEAIFGPLRCSLIGPRSTKQIPSSFPTIQEDMDGFQKYGSKYIFEVIFLDHL